jgi:hypothetical protein
MKAMPNKAMAADLRLTVEELVSYLRLSHAFDAGCAEHDADVCDYCNAIKDAEHLLDSTRPDQNNTLDKWIESVDLDQSPTPRRRP